MANDTAFSCSMESLNAGEQLFGSAPNTTVWLLLEYNRPWGAKAFPESDLEAPVKAQIQGWLDTTPQSNILLIKQPGRPASGIAFFVAVATEDKPRLYRFALDSYDDLLKIDLAALLANPTLAAAADEPVYLVCTNGRRDRCCAKYGVDLYHSLREYAGDAVWQCTHLGGHRFAPTALFLPQGLCYGRIHESEIDELIDSARQNRVYLKRYRGRVCYQQTAQAADYFLRSSSGQFALDHYRLGSVETDGDEQWRVAFHEGDEIRTVGLKQHTTDAATHTSCSAAETTPLLRFEALALSRP